VSWQPILDHFGGLFHGLVAILRGSVIIHSMMKTETYLITYHYRGKEFVARIESETLESAQRLCRAVLPNRAKVLSVTLA
jgi:hypothetical protein